MSVVLITTSEKDNAEETERRREGGLFNSLRKAKSYFELAFIIVI